MKKILSTLLLLLTAIFLVSCQTEIYYVFFDTQGGTPEISKQKINNGEFATPPEEITRTGYSFAYWYDRETNEQFMFEITPIRKDYVLYAYWNELPGGGDIEKNEYKVVFVYNDNEKITEEIVIEGSYISKPTDPIKSGFRFKGWYLTSGFEIEFDFQTPIIKDIILYAKWEERDPTKLHEYYEGYNIENLEGEALASVLRTRLNQDATFHSYGGNLNPYLIDADKHPTISGSVYTIYDGSAMSNNASGSSGSSVWNKEHVMPQSWYTGAVGRKGDLHNLRIANAQTNSTRGNLSFIDGSGSWSRVSNGFYPGDGHQGDSARIAMYMMVMYPGPLPISKVFLGSNPVETMMKWHLEDPVDEFEIRRNDVLYKYQKNRNPFIDHPEMAELIWGTYTTKLTNETKFSNLLSSINLVTNIITNIEVIVPNNRFKI